MLRSGTLLNGLSLFSPRARHSRLGLADYLGLSRQRRALGALDARRLADLGLDAHDARTEAERPFWDVPDHWIK